MYLTLSGVGFSGEFLLSQIFAFRQQLDWPTVFSLIQQPKHLWKSWGIRKTVGCYTVEEMWDVWTVGENIYGENPNEVFGRNPPLGLVQQHFQTRWRDDSIANQRKQWQQFREIPEHIDRELREGRTLQDVFQALKDL